MVVTTNRGWREQRRQDRHPFDRHALAREGLAELFAESRGRETSGPEEGEATARHRPLVTPRHGANVERRKS
jgi:hypothetical protein